MIERFAGSGMRLGVFAFALALSACGGGGGAPTSAPKPPAQNVAPIASAGRDFAVSERASATLDGSASRDPDGTIASYRWAQTAGPAVTLANAGTAVASFTAPATNAPVTLAFRLTVTDDAGATGSDDVTVTVNPVNEPPVAADGSATGDEDTTFGGTLSASDPDGDALTFAKAGDPAHGVVAVSADGSFQYTPATNFAGTDQFTFTASDGRLSSAPATVTLTVTDQPEATLGKTDDASVAESAGYLRFTVSLSRKPDGPVTIHYATADATARAGQDYVATSGDLVFDASHDTAQVVQVPVVDDHFDENDETLTLSLAVTAGADSLADAASQQATGTIQDDDDSDLLRVGAAKRSIQPTDEQIAGIEEERTFGAGTRLQRFNLGGFGINVTQNNPDVCDPSGQLPEGTRCVNDGISQVTTTEPATRRVFKDAAGEDENTNLRLFVIEQKDAPACEAASSQPGTVTTCSNLVVFVMIDAIGAGNLIQEGVKNAIVAAGAAQGVTIAPENILFGQTHSHTAADLQGLWGGVPQDWIEHVLYKAAGEAASEALKNRVASHLSFRQGYTTAFNNYRRPRVDPNADADGTITLLQATADDGTPVGSILQYNAHPTTVGDGNEPRTPHSEYILGAMEWLEGHEGGTSLYYNGPIADASPSGSRPDCANREADNPDPSARVFGEVRCRGEGIADYLLHDGNAIARRELAPTLTARSTQVVLPITNPAFVAAAGAGVFNRYYNFAQLPTDQIPGLSASQKQDLPQLAPVAVTTVSRVTIGGEGNGLEIVTIPGETTNTNADYIRKLARTKVMLLGLTHNSFGYILPEEEFSYVDQSGDDGFVLPFTGYEEYVSLGPLTAPLLRAEAYNPLFGAPVEKDVPPALSSCADASAPTTCALTMVEERLNLLVASVEACLENGPTGDGCPLQNALDMIGIGHGTIPGLGPIDAPVVDTRLTAASADALARGCDILDTSECLFPFPSDHFLVPAAPDSPQGVNSGGTGKRVNFNPLAMPRNLAGKPIDPSEWNRNDGFSPGQLIVTYVPDVGTVKGANGLPLGPIAGAVPITDLPRYRDDDAPILVLDADTGERHPIYAEIDLNAGYLLPMQGLGPRADKKPALLIRPAKNFAEGHRYVVVLRNLKKDNGEPIFAAPAFTACRDHSPDDLAAMPVVQARCQALDDAVFPVLERAGVARDASLYLAWDFTVASAHNDVARITAMRDDAFRNALGDAALSAPGDAGYPGGHAPTYAITQVTENPDGPNGKTVRRIQGTLTVPSYVVPADPSPFEGDKQLHDTLHQVADLCQSVTQGNCGVPGLADAGDGADLASGGSLPPNRLNYLPDAKSAAVCDAATASSDPSCALQARYGDGLPDRNPAGDLKTTFTCDIPRYAVGGKASMADATAGDVHPVRPTLYGHGLLGGQGEGNGQASDFGNVYGFMTCMTDWFGFASGDLGNVASALVDLSNFPVIPDGAQQGVLNMLFLARLAVHPQGFAADPAFQVGGKPVFDRREVFYNGNSQGGIMGGVVVAASKDINRGMLGVLGMNYSTLLARSTDFATYSIPLFLSYQEDLERPFVMSLMQMLWDRAENDGYAEHLTDNSAMGGPDNAVLLMPSIGDHQVTMWSAEVMARTVGAKLDRHRVRPERHPDLDGSEYFGLTPVDFAGGERWTGSALVPYDQAYDPATGTEHWHSQNDGRCNGNRTAPPPIGNVPPNRSLLIGQGPPLEANPDEFDTDAGADPHECPRRDPQARCQMSHFLLREPGLFSGDSAPELVDVSGIDIFAPGTDGDAGCPVVTITGAPDAAPPVTGAAGGSTGLLGALGDAWRSAIAALAAIPDGLAALPDQLAALAQQAGDQLAALASSFADAAPGIAQDAAGHAAGGDSAGLTADLQALLSYVVGKPATPAQPSLPPPQPLLAGAAEGAIRVPVGTPLGGYLRPPVGGEYIGDDAQAEALDNIPSQADDGTPLAPLPDELRKLHSPYATASPPSRGYYDSLMAKAVALYDGHDYVVLMKTDFIGSLDEVVQAVADKVKADTGIDLHEGLVISATHTHDGPGALANHSTRYFWAAMDVYQPEVFERLVPQLARVVEDALSGMEPARFGYAMGEEADGHSAATGFRTLNSFRRSVDFPSYDNDCSDDGLCNHGLRRRIGVLRVDHADGRPLALVMNYAAHGIAFDVENQYYSGDVLASAEREVEATFPAPAGGGKPVIAMLVQNTGGNVSPRADGGPTLQRIERFGKLLAPQVRAVYDSVDNFDREPDLRSVSQRIVLSREKLGYPDKDGNDYPYEWGAVQCNNDLAVPFADVGPNDIPGQPLKGVAPDKIPGCLPAPPPDPQDLADNGVAENGAFVPQDTRLTAVKIGHAYLLAQPGEPLSEYGVRLLKAARDQEGSDPSDTFIWGYSQDHVGYIMADEKADWDQGGTEGTTTFWGWLQGKRLREASIGLLHALKHPDEAPPKNEFEANYFYRNLPYAPAKPTPSAQPGRVVTQPAAIERFRATAFVWEGGDPVLDFPDVAMQVRDAGGNWVVARRANGRPLDRFFEMHLKYRLVSGAHLWTVEFEAPKDWPAGTYRFSVAGKAMQGGTVPYALESEPFAVAASPSLQISALATGADGRCAVTLAYTPRPQNYRIVDPIYNSDQAAPVRAGGVTFYGADGAVLAADVPVSATPGVFAMAGACPAGATAQGHDAVAAPNTSPMSAPAAGGTADADGDGVPDASDQCPSEAGPPSNNGCPVATAGGFPVCDPSGLLPDGARCLSDVPGIGAPLQGAIDTAYDTITGGGGVPPPPSGLPDQCDPTGTLPGGESCLSDIPGVGGMFGGAQPPPAPVENASCAAGKHLEGGRSYQVKIASDSGETISFQVLEPTRFDCAGAAHGAHPLILHGHGFGGSRSTTGFANFRNAGYAVISIDQRGHGDSTGTIRVMDPDYEGRDLVKILDWAEANLDYLAYANDAAPGKPFVKRPAGGVSTASANLVVGSIGGSYGGGYQLLTHAVDPKSRLDAMAPDITWHDLRWSLNPGDVLKSGWDLLLVAGGQAGSYGPGVSNHEDPTHRGLDPYIDEVLARGMATGEFPREALEWFRYHSPAYWCGLNGQYTMPYDATQWSPADPNTMVGDLRGDKPGANRRTGQKPVDVLFSQGMRDTLFNFNDAWANYQCFKQRAAGAADVRLITHESGHILNGFVNAPEPLNFENNGGTTGNDCGSRKYGDAQLEWFEDKLRRGHASPTLLGTEDSVCVSLASHDAVDIPAQRMLAPGVDGVPEGYYGVENLSAANVVEGLAAQQLHLAGNDPLVVVPLLTVSDPNGLIVAGIPQADVRVTSAQGANDAACEQAIVPTLRTGCDSIVFLGLAKKSPGDAAWTLIDDQVLPVRGLGTHMSLSLVGVGERLAAGDQLGLMVRGYSPQYVASFSRDATLPVVNVDASARLPLFAATATGAPDFTRSAAGSVQRAGGDGGNPAGAADHGLVGCLLTQDPALCQSAASSLQGLQDCPFDETGFNCAFDVAYDAIGVDTAAGVIQGLFDQCAASPAAPACAAVQSSGNGALPDRVIVASTMIERGALEYAEQAPVPPSAKTVDGRVDDWMAQATRIGGTDVFEYGEHVYSDFLFDAFGADDGDDARRLAVLALTGDASDRLGRLDALQQAAGDQLGVPQPAGSRADHYGDATNREDGTDLTEVRWAADGSDLFFLARVAKLENPANLVVVVLADTDDAAAGMNGLDAGLTTRRFDRAVVLKNGGATLINLVTGGTQALATLGGAVAVRADGDDNALEARIPRVLLERADGKLDVAVMTVRESGGQLIPANVAYRPHEPVTIYNERAQAMALFAHTVDPFVETISVADLVGGRTQLARPGPGYHERQFVSGANVSNESDPEQGRLQPYGLYVPHGIGGDALHPARLTIWTHYRGGKAHSGASWTPRLIKELSGEEGGLTSDEPKNLVVTPGARGTSTWYTTRAHQDFFEVFADVAGTLALNQYAAENLPADSEATAHGLFAVDPAHIYVSGYSMGGYATYLFTGLYPDLFAAGFSQSGAVTQGAWTGYGPDDAQCLAPPQEIPVEGDAGNLCFVEANDSRADAQLNWRLLENTRWVPLEINHGTNDELALTPGAVRMGERLAELGYRHDMMLFIGYEHYTQAIMDEWADGAHYLNRFARPENPRQVTYKLVPALVKAVNEVQLKGANGGQPFRFHPDGAYWVDDLKVREGADGSIPASGVVPFGRIDAESGRLAGASYLPVPRSGSDADNGPYASTPAYSPGNQTTPFVRSGLDWQETGTLAPDANTFSATLVNLSAATLDLARMGFAGHFDAPIDGSVASDGAAVLTLAHVGADMTACVGGHPAGSVAAGGDAAVTLASGANAIRLVPGLGASCDASVTPPAPPSAAPDVADVCDAYGVAGAAPLCDGLRSAQSQLAAQCEASGAPAETCSLSGGNLHALLDACYQESGGSAAEHRDGAPLPVCRVIDALVGGAAAYCRQVAMATADAARPELCGLINGVVVSESALERYESSWTHKALTLQARLGFGLPLLSSQVLHTHNSFNATDGNTPPTLSGSDYNQYYDIPGQLRMDIRAIEIDVHWMPGRAGSVATRGFEPMVCHGDTDSRTPLGPDPNVGCTTERPLGDVLAALRAWLDAHPDEVVMLYIEDHLTEGNADTTQSYPATAQVFEQYLGDRVWRTGAEGCDEDADPVAFLRVSRQQIAAAGKQVFMISESCSADASWNSMFHRKKDANVHQGTQSSFAGFSYENGCALPDEAGFITGSRGQRWTRIWEDSTVVTATAGGGAPASVTPAVTHELMRCGLSLPGFDRLYPADGRLDAAVWSWAPDEPKASAALNCAAQGADGRFVAADCGESRPYACVSNADANAWQVAGNGAWADASCPSGFHFSVPANGYANEQLREAAHGNPVWLNYTDAAADGQWTGDATPPPPLPGANAPPGSSLGQACRAIGAPETLCGALDSLTVGVNQAAASLTGEAAYDRCLGGVCLSQAPVVGNLALNALAPLLNDAPRGVWLKGDMHVHDDHSADGSGPRQTLGQGAPGNVSVADQIHFAENVGLDFLPLTDHRTFDQHYDPLWTSDKLLLITGEEANGSPHANVFGATDMINQADNPPGAPEFRKLQQSIWDAQLQGAAWSTNHPDDGELVDNADGTPARDAAGHVVVNSFGDATGPNLCEIWNRGTLNRPKIEYCESRWNAGWRTGIAGASDDHFRELWALAGPGEPTTYAFARDASTPALLDALRAGRTGVHLNASAPFVTLEGDFDGDGTFETIMGDEARVAPGAIARLRVTVEHGIGTHVDVYRMPGLAAGPFLTFVPTLPTQRFTFEIQAPRDANGQDWYRVEVRGPGDPDALDYNQVLDCSGLLALPPDASSCQPQRWLDADYANPLRALTSPIFVSSGALAQPASPELPADAGLPDGAVAIAGEPADNAFAGFADVAESDGVVHMVAQVRDERGSHVVYRRRAADGTLAPAVDLAPDSRLASLPRIAASGADVWAVWQDDRDGERPHRSQVYARHSGDAGASWDPEILVSASAGRAEHPALALLAPELPVIVWQDNDGGAFDVLARVLGRDDAPVNLSAEGKAVSAGNPADSRSAIHPASVRPSVAIGPDGAIAVAWQDNRNDPDPGWTGHAIHATPEDVQASIDDGELHEAGTQTDDWEIFARTLAPGAAGWSAIANVSNATHQADRNVTLAYDDAGTLHAAWDAKDNGSMAGPRLSIRASESADGASWSAPMPVALAADYSSQRPAFGRNGPQLSLFWMDGRSSDWRWRVMRADLRGAAGFGAPRFVTGPGNAAWPAFANGWLAFTSDRAATREQRKPQQAFLLQLERPIPAGAAAAGDVAPATAAFDLCDPVTGRYCLSQAGALGQALLAALAPIVGPDPNPAQPLDPLLAACRANGVPDALCARAEDLALSGAGLSRWVDPRIGSYPPGFTNPGPAAPYGLVELGPDTEGPINYGGYYQHNALVSGFSHVHMSAGAYKGGYIPVLPFTGTLTPGDLDDVTQGADHPMPAYSSTFDHAAESADAGYYAVLLSRYGVFAELTATARAGLHRYTFNDPAQAPRVLFDVSRSLEGYHDASVALRDGGVLVGRVHSDNAGGFDVYFAARVSEPFTATTLDGAALDAGGAAASGDHAGAILDFPGKPRQVLVKVGVSYTDEDGALANLDAEIPGWDFDAVRGATRAAWDEALARVQVEGGTLADHVSFYTALYHAQQFPNLHSDVDGRYRGPDRQVHADSRPHYSQFSSWDSYRGQNQLQAEIVPERYADMIHSLADFADQNGGTLPRWQEGPRDASHMSGDPIVPFIGEAWCRGQLDAGTQARLWPQMLRLVANRDARLAQLGYLPVDKPDLATELQGGSGRAGTTLEYGIADFSLALMAQAAAPADAGAIARRSLNYRNLLDPSTRWIRPRHDDGSWLTPFAPELGYGFQEGTSWQYSWLAMHDVAGVVARMGGDDAVNARLDEFFNLPADAAPVAWPTVQNQATAFGVAYYGNQYAPGNEHDLEAPYLYNYTGQAWKSAYVARAAESIYTPTPNGLPGNDDLGALSGWLVWTMAGLYPMNPGTPLAVIGSPVFEKVTFKRAGGDLVVEAPGASAVDKYVQSVTIDGAPSERTWLTLPRTATTVRIALGAAPNLDWGKAVSSRPPSLSAAPLAAFGCATPSAGVPDEPAVSVGAGEVTATSGEISRTWSRKPFRTERLVDARTGKVWSQDSADFTLTIGGAEVASDAFEVVGTPDVVRLPGGAVRLTLTLAPSGFATLPVGLTVTRAITMYPGVAGMRTETWLNSIAPLAISAYTLDQANPSGRDLVGTIHSFRAGSDWRDPEWTGPALVVGDPAGGDWRRSESGTSVSGTAQWLSVRDGADRRLFMVMERNDYASSMMGFAPGRARAFVDLSRDVIYLGPLEEQGHLGNPGPGPARSRVAMPGVPLRLEPVFTGLAASGDDEPWQHYKYFAGYRMPAYRREVTFNSNGVDANRISTGAKDDMDLAETQRQAAIARALGIETFVLDDGWQARSGDWCPDSDSGDPACVEPRRGSEPKVAQPRFPDSTFAAVRASLGGMNLGLWMSPLHFHPSAVAFQNNPQWSCQPIDEALLAEQESDPSGGSNEAGILQWNPEATGPDGKAIDYIEGRIRRAIEVYGARYFKFDFTAWLDCGGASPVDLYGYRESFMAMLDRILADHPDVTIQMDETNDYRLFPFEALARGPTWYQNGSPTTSEALHATWTLAPFVPPYALGRNALNVGRLGSDSAAYQMAVALLSHVTFFNDLAGIPAGAIPVIRAWTDYYKAHRADFAQMGYPLLADDPLDPANWAAFQLWDPEQGRGVLLAYRQDSAQASQVVALRNVPDGAYRLYAAPDDRFYGRFTAAQLRAGIDIGLAAPRSASVLRIERE